MQGAKVSIEDLVAHVVRTEIESAFLRAGALRGPPPTVEFMSVKEAAVFARVHVNTIRGWIKQAKLTRYGGPGKHLVRKDELVRLLESTPSNKDDFDAEARAQEILRKRK